MSRSTNRSNSRYCLVLTAVSDAQTAGRLADALVNNRLCACVSVVPGAISRYRWQGRVQRAEEAILIAKTSSSRYAEVESFLSREHPYECPEILKIPVEAGLPAYLDWIRESVSKVEELES